MDEISAGVSSRAAKCLLTQHVEQYNMVFVGSKKQILMAIFGLDRKKSKSGRWTLKLLAEKRVELEYVASVSKETVRQTLKKMNLNPD